MSFADDLTRRRVLRGGAAMLAGAVAGCSADSTETPTPNESVFRGTSFDGPDLVVELQADHEVSRVTLVGPDGSAVTSEDIAAGTTTVRLPILRIQPATGFEHYEPGGNELVAVLEDRTESVDIDLRPEPSVTGIEQYRTGDRAVDLAKLAVTVENVGTGPTWVYDVTYRDAPNATANDDLGDDPGAPQLAKPDEPAALILEPGARATYVGTTAPLLFAGDEQPDCDGEVELSVLVSTAVGEPLKRRIRATVGGEVTLAGLKGEYTCSAVEVEPLDGGPDG